ncbi:septation ring formation regulator EzrA [Kurthia sibirica]|uniref:Septation ring formation regulator EzrA n=1 Tax=Kurthia sibirica TaxID=202750 RepID=A0A2U3ANV7_9BACL|nr:septation ring formation regulator EzrA [Kurthia sibirica]PWI26224.1 septation ring formation regulator EzrA [Kurthia sibirica]GEK35531.1 septation ring formation regulator EzrA [Kurthia sibirica]
MEYIIPVVIVLLVFVVGVFVFRKKHHTEISRLDQKKLDIQNKPVLEELSKVKSLNMSGQAEEMFERWRNKWTELIDVEMPKIDELLFQVEEFVDKFQLKKATVLEMEIEKLIENYDAEMEVILKELNELMESEQQNRIEIEQLKDDYRSARKTLLAHQYAFGAAGEPLEKRLEAFPPAFEEYDHMTVQGNYMQAKEIVIDLHQQGVEIFRLINEIPTLLTEIQHKIPADLNDIRNGHIEMTEQSFFLLHLEIPEKLDDIEHLLPHYKEQVTKLETTDVSAAIEQIKTDIDSFYDLLEKEVVAKQYVDANFPPIGLYLAELIQDINELKVEADIVKKSYHLTEKEMLIPIESKAQLNSVKQRYELLAVEVQERQSAYSSIHEELLELQKLMDQEAEKRAVFAERMSSLRVNEDKGRDQLTALQKRLHAVERKISKANTPGTPEEIDARISEAEEQLFVVNKGLNEVPINMGTIVADIEKGHQYVTEIEVVVEEMLENINLIELLIQYGNRYRMVKPGMNERLLEAEEAFRDLRFNRALEIVATAVETAEPGALKKMKVQVKDTVTKG